MIFIFIKIDNNVIFLEIVLRNWNDSGFKPKDVYNLSSVYNLESRGITSWGMRTFADPQVHLREGEPILRWRSWVWFVKGTTPVSPLPWVYERGAVEPVSWSQSCWELRQDLLRIATRSHSLPAWTSPPYRRKERNLLIDSAESVNKHWIVDNCT